MKYEEAKKRLDKTTRGEFSFYADFVNDSIKNLNLSKNSRILDIGTGWGIMAIILALNGFDVLTGEPKGEVKGEHHGKSHNEFYSNWRESAKAVGVEDQIKYEYLDVEDLPFPDNSFDAIFMLDTLQHVKHRGQALAECLRVVRRGGIITLFEMNEKGVKYCKRELRFTPELVIPMNYLENDNKSSVETLIGQLVNAYILRKN